MIAYKEPVLEVNTLSKENKGRAPLVRLSWLGVALQGERSLVQSPVRA